MIRTRAAELATTRFAQRFQSQYRLCHVAMPACLTLIAFAHPAAAGDWSERVDVRRAATTCVSYRAKLSGEWLLIEAKHAPGWHTYAMDNERRAHEQLKGKKPLGIESPTEISFLSGLTRVGPWYQSEPRDYSKPDLRWFTWGFEGDVVFAARVERLGTARISVKGQTCDEKSCHLVDIEIQLPTDDGEVKDPAIDISELVRVHQPGDSN